MDGKRVLSVVFVSLVLFSGVAAAEPWNVTDASQEQSFASGEDGTSGVFFKPDGTQMYVTTYGSDTRIYQFELSEPWDISTASQVATFGYGNRPSDIWFKPDGTRMYISSDVGASIREYHLSTPWDIESRTAIRTSGHGVGDGLAFNNDGTIVYTNTGSNGVQQAPLSEAWNISTIGSATGTIGGLENEVSGFTPGDDGDKFFLMGGGVNHHEYNLTTPYDISTSTLNRTGNPSDNGLYWKDDGSAFWTARGENVIEYSTFSATISGTVKDADGNPLDNATVSNNVTTVTDTTGADGFYEIPADDGTYEITASKADYNDNSTTVTVSGSDVTDANITLFKEAQLELDVRGYMKHGTVQGYTVTANQSGTETVVTSQATVTSSNSTVVSVDQTESELIATSDVTINDVATITAEYQGKQVTKDVTVANRTIDNIGIMPSPQWIPTILGIGESGTGPGGIGSELQWLLVLIMIMYGVTYQTNSASVGIGIGVGGVIALWAAGYVSVGMLLSTMLFGAFIALTTLDLQNDQTVVHEYR